MPKAETKTSIVRLAIKRCRVSPWNIRSSRIKGRDLQALKGPNACAVLKRFEIKRRKK